MSSVPSTIILASISLLATCDEAEKHFLWGIDSPFLFSSQSPDIDRESNLALCQLLLQQAVNLVRILIVLIVSCCLQGMCFLSMEAAPFYICIVIGWYVRKSITPLPPSGQTQWSWTINALVSFTLLYLTRDPGESWSESRGVGNWMKRWHVLCLRRELDEHETPECCTDLQKAL